MVRENRSGGWLHSWQSRHRQPVGVPLDREAHVDHQPAETIVSYAPLRDASFAQGAP
ncbi:hypothetical protein ART_1047 [Arthrobacter sp. PAMC 25486]|nr:hypothetical protein ART_1047 [Arthrobacter sp. PAMC 25486]